MTLGTPKDQVALSGAAPREAPRIRRALLSVTDKTGIVELARGLADKGVELLSTGGTARQISDAEINVRPIDDLTGFPECLDGRVKTLHPKVHGGILHMRDNEDHLRQVAELDIEPIDLVAVNLYAFERTVAKQGVTLAEAIENIDIGGPSMVRSAAKNWRDVVIVTDPADYSRILSVMETHNGGVPQTMRFELAAKAFALTARYDAAIANYLEQQDPAPDTLPRHLRLEFEHAQELRYGENPHQGPAHYYRDAQAAPGTLATARQISGKELSYNNLVDLDAALALVSEFDQPAAVCIKHTNPCGAAIAGTLAEAFTRAHAGDPVSAFGCIVGLNRPVDRKTAETMAEEAGFVEAVIAPDFEDEGLQVLTGKAPWRKNVRLLKVGEMNRWTIPDTVLRQVSGGMLTQPADVDFVEWDALKVVTRAQPDAATMDELRFAWVVCKHFKRNAIVLVKDNSLVGLCAGQVSRVDSSTIAVMKAGDRAKGAVLASDAFFPFRDGVDAAAKAGARAIIQPGGSKRDEETIAAANEHGIPMVFTGRRHFRH